MAHSLHMSLMDSSFIVIVFWLANILSITLPLSRLCKTNKIKQTKTIDKFCKKCCERNKLLKEKRKSAEVFHYVFIEAE